MNKTIIKKIVLKISVKSRCWLLKYNSWIKSIILREIIIKISNYDNNNINSNKRWMPEGLGVVLDSVFRLKFRSFVPAKWF